MSTPLQTPIPVSPDATPADHQKPKDRTSSVDTIDLPSGTELTELEALSLATSRPVRWVVIAGQVDSGKTTLLTSLYELLQWAPIENYCFAGSDTLPAFEQRCHLSRAASERAEADTARTPYKGPVPKYLHLKVVRTGEIRETIDFLFTDVSGEVFEHARDSTEECKELTFLRRTKTFLLILDGEKLERLDKRWGVVEDTISLLRSCLDSNMIARDCVVTVVWSKIDYFVGAPNAAGIQTFRHDVEARFRATFESRIGQLQFAEVASRPSKAKQLGFGKGLPELLKDRLSNSPVMRKMSLFPEPARGCRESEAYALRRPAPREAE